MGMCAAFLMDSTCGLAIVINGITGEEIVKLLCLHMGGVLVEPQCPHHQSGKWAGNYFEYRISTSAGAH